MNNIVTIFLLFATLGSICCVAQPSKFLLKDKNNPKHDISMEEFAIASASQVKSYHVEERINMNFGGRITTYEVSSINLIGTNDLGPNNVRIVTPRYIKAKPVRSSKLEVQPVKINASPVKIEKVEFSVPTQKKDYVEIDLARTYERVLEKGYVSPDLMMIVANRRFFDGDLEEAAVWYAKLFELKKDLEPVYNYRYAQCLRAIGKIEQAEKMMKVFEDTFNIK